MVLRPLRICLLTYRGNPRSGGQGVYVRLLSQALGWPLQVHGGPGLGTCVSLWLPRPPG